MEISLVFAHQTNLAKILRVFVPQKFEKTLQVFVPGTNRENFYKFLSLCQNWETKFFDLKNVPHGSSRGDVPTRYKACTRIVTKRVHGSPPVTNREFGLTTYGDIYCSFFILVGPLVDALPV